MATAVGLPDIFATEIITTTPTNYTMLYFTFTNISHFTTTKINSLQYLITVKLLINLMKITTKQPTTLRETCKIN